MRKTLGVPSVLGAVGICLTVACGSDGGKALVNARQLAAGEQGCENGGVAIEVGNDANGDDKLSQNEVAKTAVTCNGPDGMDGTPGTDGADGIDGFPALVNMYTLELGNPLCPYGGVKIEVGLDNGDGGGTAKNGVLEPGEVDDCEEVCKSQPLFVVKPMWPPEYPACQFTMDASGGDGGAGTPGAGGSVELYLSYGSLGGNLKSFATGHADAGFECPDPDGVDLGPMPFLVDADYLVEVYDGAEPVDLEYHTHPLDSNLYYGSATVPDEIVTGMQVDPDVTLTFAPNDPGAGEVHVHFGYGVENQGTITTTSALGVHASLYLYAAAYFGAEASVVDVSGGVEAGAGQSGATVEIYAGTDLPLMAINHGTLLANGGSGDTGGDGGYIYLESQYVTCNDGPLLAYGGDATGDAGDGGGAYLYGYHGKIWNAGLLDAHGGASTAGGAGGDGGWAEFYLEWSGDVRNTGTLDARGGSTSGGAAQAGAGGEIYVYAWGATITSSGDMLAQGGDGLDDGSSGGEGGTIDIESAYGMPLVGDVRANGDVVLSGNMLVGGGEGAAGGGGGGSVYVDLDTEYVPNSQELILYGYCKMMVNGGSSGADGAGAGDVYLDNDHSHMQFPGEYGPSGGVVNYVAIEANGGQGVTGSGGNGGYIEMITDTAYTYATGGEVVKNFGEVYARGGEGGEAGGNGGTVFFNAGNLIESYNQIKVEGGTADDNPGLGGSGGFVTLATASGETRNAACIGTDGGDAPGTEASGGSAGDIELMGVCVYDSGDLSATGGDGGAYGGNGAEILLYGEIGGVDFDVDAGATADVAGGTGTIEDGAPGRVSIIVPSGP